MATSEITIREATRDDVDMLVSFQRSLALETEDKRLDPNLLHRGVVAILCSPERGFYLVGEMQGYVVGGLLVTYEWSDWRNATFWWIQSVYVASECRLKGIYRAMHEHVYKAARSRRDVCGIRLCVDRNNTIAQQIYTRLGMVKSHYDLFEVDFVL